MNNILTNPDRSRVAKALVLRFFELPVGARFEFRGHRYQKVARGFAADEERMGNLFHADTEVITDNDSPLGRARYAGTGLSVAPAV